MKQKDRETDEGHKRNGDCFLELESWNDSPFPSHSHHWVCIIFDAIPTILPHTYTRGLPNVYFHRSPRLYRGISATSLPWQDISDLWQFGPKTVRIWDTLDIRHFGTSAEVSVNHFGTVGCRSVKCGDRHSGVRFRPLEMARYKLFRVGSVLGSKCLDTKSTTMQLSMYPFAVLI